MTLDDELVVWSLFFSFLCFYCRLQAFQHSGPRPHPLLSYESPPRLHATPIKIPGDGQLSADAADGRRTSYNRTRADARQDFISFEENASSVFTRFPPFHLGVALSIGPLVTGTLSPPISLRMWTLGAILCYSSDSPSERSLFRFPCLLVLNLQCFTVEAHS